MKSAARTISIGLRKTTVVTASSATPEDPGSSVLPEGPILVAARPAPAPGFAPGLCIGRVVGVGVVAGGETTQQQT